VLCVSVLALGSCGAPPDAVSTRAARHSFHAAPHTNQTPPNTNRSEAVIAKCAALVKQNLHRHTPSRGVLLAVQAGAQKLAASLPPTSDVGKSLLFLSASAARLERGGEGPAAAAASTSQTDVVSDKAAAEAWRHRGANVADSYSAPSSEAAVVGGGGGSGWAAGGSLRGSRLGVGEEGEGEQEDWLQHGDALMEEEEELMAMGAARPVVGEGEAPPAWALAAEDLPWPHLLAAAADAAGLMGGARATRSGRAADEAASAVDWADLVPEYSESLAPLLQGVYDQQGGALPALDCHQVISSFSGAHRAVISSSAAALLELRSSC